MSIPAMSTPATWCRVVHSRDFSRPVQFSYGALQAPLEHAQAYPEYSSVLCVDDKLYKDKLGLRKTKPM